MPDHITIRDSVTDGPVPEFDDTPQISLEGVGVVAPGDVVYHGQDSLILTDIDLGENPDDATLYFFNQRTTVTTPTNAGKFAELIRSNHPMFHFEEIVIPADATYHTPSRAEQGLPRQL